MENKYLEVKKESFFNKITSFIKKMFYKNVQEEITEEIKDETFKVEKEIKSDFMQQIRVYSEEETELLNLQELYENGDMSLAVMSNEELNELNLLYKRQIEDLKEKLEEKKKQFISLKNKLDKNNKNQ